MIDRIRLSSTAKNQLVTLKRKTGIEHYNAICRHALCLSLANPSQLPAEIFNFNGGLEIDWRTFSGGEEEVYLNLLLIRMVLDGASLDIDSIKMQLNRHIHRGLSYLASKGDADLASFIAQKLSTSVIKGRSQCTGAN